MPMHPWVDHLVKVNFANKLNYFAGINLMDLIVMVAFLAFATATSDELNVLGSTHPLYLIPNAYASPASFTLVKSNVIVVSSALAC